MLLLRGHGGRCFFLFTSRWLAAPSSSPTNQVSPGRRIAFKSTFMAVCRDGPALRRPRYDEDALREFPWLTDLLWSVWRKAMAITTNTNTVLEELRRPQEEIASGDDGVQHFATTVRGVCLDGSYERRGLRQLSCGSQDTRGESLECRLGVCSLGHVRVWSVWP